MSDGNGQLVPAMQLRSLPANEHVVGASGSDPVAQLADDLMESGIGPHAVPPSAQGARPTELRYTSCTADHSDIDRQIERIKTDPVAALRDFADQAGYAPQRQQLLAVTIAGISAAAGNPVNISLVGELSEGKSTVIKASVKLLGEEFVASSSAMQTMTAAAMSRMTSRLTNHAKGVLPSLPLPGSLLEWLSTR